MAPVASGLVTAQQGGPPGPAQPRSHLGATQVQEWVLSWWKGSDHTRDFLPRKTVPPKRDALPWPGRVPAVAQLAPDAGDGQEMGPSQLRTPDQEVSWGLRHSEVSTLGRSW